MNIAERRIDELLTLFMKKRVLVLGDLILDQFIWGDVSRISPEAPVPVVAVSKESYMPGGAANVALGIHALNGKADLVGVIGKDRFGTVLKQKLARKVNTGGIVVDASRTTSLKTRIVARQQQVVRVDREHLHPLSTAIADTIVRYFQGVIEDIDGVIIEDYGKGVVNPYLIKEVIALARQHDKIITVDPKEDHFAYYRGATCITPNQLEAEKATGIKIIDTATLFAAGRKLMQMIQGRAILITRGEHGMCLFEKGKTPLQIPTRAQEVFDVSGAGDTVIATYTLALASGATHEEAAHVANFAAGVVVGKLGVATCSPQELRRHILRGTAEES